MSATTLLNPKHPFKWRGDRIAPPPVTFCRKLSCNVCGSIVATPVSVAKNDEIAPRPLGAFDLRSKRVEEFLQARSLTPKSQRAYQQDLKRFLDWTDSSWAEVTPRQVAQFKSYLIRLDPDTGQRVLSDATASRTLGTLKNFFGWMFRSRYVNHDPTTEVDRPKLKEPTAQNIKADNLELIYQAATGSNLPKRNIALISVLLHGLRASVASALNLEDYDGQRLLIQEAKADSIGMVPLRADL